MPKVGWVTPSTSFSSQGELSNCSKLPVPPISVISQQWLGNLTLLMNPREQSLAEDSSF